ncbi:MAG: recombinase family protein [Pirellulales bacterium]|nr:recombinase family protein [Pirellulales bacterium]
MPNVNLTKPRRVYSYIRFSTPEQAMGDSERRQLDMAKSWAARNNHVLDESLRMTDRGLSGYHGTHRKKGALGRFLKMVEAGQIPPGSILLVESIDRLSREEFITSFDTVKALLSNDITIHTLDDDTDYTKESLSKGLSWKLFGKVESAHESSQRRSDLGKANWEKKRKDALDGKITARRDPAWIKTVKNKDKRYVEIESLNAIPEAADAIRMIFDLKRKGIGKDSIARILNEKAAWTPPPNANSKSEGWHGCYIQKILKNPAVMGVLQFYRKVKGKRIPVGNPIPDYYPKIIEPGLFHSVQSTYKENKGTGGRNGKVRNLFPNIIKCAYCGGAMAYKGDGRHSYLVCDNARRGVKCKIHSVRYDEVESSILDNCHKLQPVQVLPNPDEQSMLIYAIQQRIEGMEAELRDIAERIGNFVNAVGESKSPSAREKYEEKITELEGRQVEIKKALENDRQTFDKEQKSLQSFTNWKHDLETLKEARDPITRLKIRAHLRRFIEKIDVFSVGHIKMYSRGYDKEKRHSGDGEFLAFTLDALNDEYNLDLPKGFLEYVTERRMSKKGRFYRVHFKTGKIIDVVPPGSIASGKKLICTFPKTKWNDIMPDVEKLLQEFRASK